MKAPRRGRPPKAPADVRTVRVTVLLTERESATLSRACGGRGVATLLREAGLREAAPDADECAMLVRQLDAEEALKNAQVRTASVLARAMFLSQRDDQGLRHLDVDQVEAIDALLRWQRTRFEEALEEVGKAKNAKISREALTVTSGQRVGKSEATRKVGAAAKAAGVSVKVVKR